MVWCYWTLRGASYYGEAGISCTTRDILGARDFGKGPGEEKNVLQAQMEWKEEAS
jgi:hypothetical protein